MWSVELVVGVTLISAACVLIVGVALVGRFEHRRHRKLVNSHVSLARGLSTYHRTQLSIDGNNYSHVRRPDTSLRRSRHLPYGLAVEEWCPLPAKEHIISPQMTEQRPDDIAITEPKRRRNLCQTLYGNSFQMPKTRRQRKVEKAIPMNSMQRSPLSAITELTDSTSEDMSPAIGVTELPCETTLKDIPQTASETLRDSCQVSIQWPLPLAKKRSEDVPAVQETSVAARKSILMRMNGTTHILESKKPSLGPRSLSMASNISIAPEEPLPPLPPLKTKRLVQGSAKSRLSTASMDTVGSSVLGSIIPSPPRGGTDAALVDGYTPQINLHSPGLQDFSYLVREKGPSALTFGHTGGKQAMHGYRRGQMGFGSFRASVGTNEMLRTASTNRHPDCRSDKVDDLKYAAFRLDRSDSRGWEHARNLEDGRAPSSLSPSLPASRARTRGSSDRHTMLEHQMLNRMWTTRNKGLSSELEDDPELISLPPRPASVANSHPAQWDMKAEFANLRRLSLRGSPVKHKKGHKRQNCVRISNLPPPDSASRESRLPQMAEEEEEESETPEGSPSKIPGLTLLETGAPALRMRASLVDIKASPSPFQNRPILEPTSHSIRPRNQRISSYRSTGIPRRDSDVFSGSHSDPVSPNIFASAASPRQAWQLSPTPSKTIRLSFTPPALREPEDYYDPDSPMLPSPVYNSGALFPRMSLVRGPRRLPTPGFGAPSRIASPSPIGNRHIPKRPGDDLRRSVMAMRRMTSEGKLLDCNSRIYRNLGEENSSSFSISANFHTPYGSIANMRSSPNTSQLLQPRPLKPGSSTFRVSRSKMSMALSPSVMSTGGTSIWEDASVRGDSPEPEMPGPRFRASVRAVEADDFENLVRPSRDENDRLKEERLTSPHGKGLGLMVGGKVWGTPGSLYDREGFLKDF